jgi:hypothetical protein
VSELTNCYTYWNNRLMHLHHSIIVSTVTYDLIGFFLSLSHPVSIEVLQNGASGCWQVKSMILEIISWDSHPTRLFSSKWKRRERGNSSEDNPDPGQEQGNTMSRMDIDRNGTIVFPSLHFKLTGLQTVKLDMP